MNACEKWWGIFDHQRAGRSTHTGYVVRECTPTGEAFDRFNYGNAEAVRLYKRQTAAERAARKMNGASE